MPSPIENVQRVHLSYEFMCKLEGIHRQASLGCILPYRRPRANCRRFVVILKMLVDDSETSETLNPTEIFCSIYFVYLVQRFQRF